MMTENANQKAQKLVDMELTQINGEKFYKISHHDQLRPFFMSVVSDSNHWMFISSNGGLTAGRKNAEFALFPYYTDDKITEFADITGSKTIFQIHQKDEIRIWEPFSERFNENYNLTRNLYKNTIGNKIIFEEIHHDFNVTFRYQWANSHVYGFVRTSEIINHGTNAIKITLLDGLQNILPQGINSDFQMGTSNLGDAYKRNELDAQSGLGIFALSAIIVDKAEPSEALKANIAWSLGLEKPLRLMSSLQVQNFRKKLPLIEEQDVKGEKGAYFVSTDVILDGNASKSWKIIANVNQNQAQVIEVIESILNDKSIEKKVEDDVKLGSQKLISIVATADGLQQTADHRKDARHFSNVLFNVMRGGIFDHHYQIEKHDFELYLSKANTVVFQNERDFIKKLPELFTYSFLQKIISNTENIDLIRLCTEYLPLKFSRRHGDPSRPWNKFSINTQNEIDGSKILDYEGNWRDIFQNWESLAYAFPNFIEGMIFKFLNATTFDGYNPYRVTKGGFDWETIEPDNPWSYIGYWGDHQIIYLLKFLEFAEKAHPGKLHSYFDKSYFVYAAVPYIIRPYHEILQNPKETISFDHAWDAQINDQKKSLGADGALMTNQVNKNIHHVNFIEKILATVLSKMSNFIPEGGIWMNTQRPEWNDANNALVGNGVSMVTLYYLRRFLKFFDQILAKSSLKEIEVSIEMVEFFEKMYQSLNHFKPSLSGTIEQENRKKILDLLGISASEFRNSIYQKGFQGSKKNVSFTDLIDFTKICLDYLDHSIQANKRKDNLYHAYNLMSVKNDGIVIEHLPEMLEGQVAVLSSGILNANESLEIINALRNSALYRNDQQSYILYPNKTLLRFLEKNTIPNDLVQKSSLLKQLLGQKNSQIVNQDLRGGVHFNGNFHNANDLKRALNELKNHSEFSNLVNDETELVLEIFEEVFNHKAFTGRSGTFFGYEGLGSIYWHMVSKLHLAVQETCDKAIENNENQDVIDQLQQHFDTIGQGIGIHKTPEVYGAFPTDPYSHTPFHRGAQQPGMTGQVKEDILVRMAELGVKIKNGKIHFAPHLLHRNEFIEQKQEFHFVNLEGTPKTMVLEPHSLAFTVCQIPVVYTFNDSNTIEITFKTGGKQTINSLELDEKTSQSIFERNDEIEQIKVAINPKNLRS